MSFVFPELPSWLLHDISPPFEYVRDTDALLALDSHTPPSHALSLSFV